MECGAVPGDTATRSAPRPDAACIQIPLRPVSQMSPRCHGSFSTIPPWFLFYDSSMTPP